MAYISFRNITSTSFEAKVYDLATAGSYGHYVEWLLDGKHWSSENLADDATSSGWMTFDGLKPDMDYSVEAHNLTNEGAVLETVGKFCHTEAASAADEWYISDTDTWSDVTSTTNKEYHIPEYGVVRIKFWFATSGTARFYSSGASGGYAAISDSTKFKPENGAPVTALAEGESKRGDFEFTYDVEAQTTYYLFVSNYRETDSGYIDVYIEPPSGSSGGWMIAHETNYSSISSTKSNDYDLLAGEVAKIRVSFSRSGTAQFYAEGSIDNIAFLSDQSSEYFDTSSGQPSNILVQDDDSGADSNFSFTYDVVA